MKMAPVERRGGGVEWAYGGGGGSARGRSSDPELDGLEELARQAGAGSLFQLARTALSALFPVSYVSGETFVMERGGLRVELLPTQAVEGAFPYVVRSDGPIDGPVPGALRRHHLIAEAALEGTATLSASADVDALAQSLQPVVALIPA